jgi:hypothetical protein
MALVGGRMIVTTRTLVIGEMILFAAMTPSPEEAGLLAMTTVGAIVRAAAVLLATQSVFCRDPRLIRNSGEK